MRLISKVLRSVVPIAAAGMVWDHETLKDIEDEIDLMTVLVKELPNQDMSSTVVASTARGGDAHNESALVPERLLASAEGAGLRVFRTLLFELDKSQYFGGLRRVLNPSGDYLWVCPSHYLDYDPGVPERVG